MTPEEHLLHNLDLVEQDMHRLTNNLHRLALHTHQVFINAGRSTQVQSLRKEVDENYRAANALRKRLGALEV